jgi:hypothetical protein
MEIIYIYMYIDDILADLVFCYMQGIFRFLEKLINMYFMCCRINMK